MTPASGQQIETSRCVPPAAAVGQQACILEKRGVQRRLGSEGARNVARQHGGMWPARSQIRAAHSLSSQEAALGKDARLQRGQYGPVSESQEHANFDLPSLLAIKAGIVS